jgi:hypothetical protein
MGLDSLAGLKPAGGSILLLASLGFLVYDSLYCSIIDETSLNKARAGFGVRKQLYDCGLSLAVLGGVVGVLLLVLLILSFLGVSLPKAVGLILWIIPLVLFLGLLIAGSLAVDGSKDGDSEYFAREDWVYNTSDTVKKYVDAYYAWQASPHQGQGNGLGRLTVNASGTQGQRALGSEAAGPRGFNSVRSVEWTWEKIQQSTAAEFCAHYISEHATPVGVNPYYQRYVLPLEAFQAVGGSTQSLETLVFSELGDTSPSWYYYPDYIPSCYDSEADENSLADAVTKNDLCAVTLKDGAKCAPGWTPELFVKAVFCDRFNGCIDRFNFAKDSGLLKEAPIPSYPEGYYQAGFPKGWDALDDLKAAYRKYIEDPKSNLYGSPVTYHLANSILLGFAVVGAVFLLIGVIVEAMGDGNRVSVG